MKTSEEIIRENQEIQKRNHPDSQEWKDAHEAIKAEVLKVHNVDIDGRASWKH